MPDETMTPEELAAAVDLSIAMIAERGREEYGIENFDSMCQDLTSVIGADNLEKFKKVVVQCDAPARVYEHLAAFPDRAKEIARMPQARMHAALGRIEAQLMPNAGNFGAEPAWLARERSAEKRGLGDDLSDSQWERNFKKKYPDGFIPPRLR